MAALRGFAPHAPECVPWCMLGTWEDAPRWVGAAGRAGGRSRRRGRSPALFGNGRKELGCTCKPQAASRIQRRSSHHFSRAACGLRGLRACSSDMHAAARSRPTRSAKLLRLPDACDVGSHRADVHFENTHAVVPCSLAQAGKAAQNDNGDCDTGDGSAHGRRGRLHTRATC